MWGLALVLVIGCARPVAPTDEQLSEEETRTLVVEADRWRSGVNRTCDLGRALEMYELASQRGTGRSARRSTFELGLLREKGCRWPAIGGAFSARQTACPVERDVAAALELFSSAAKRGHPGAQYSLAVALASDAYVVGDEKQREVLSGYLKTNSDAAAEDVAVLHEYFAALGNEPLAQMAMGARHLYGVGVPAKCDSALTFYEAAADAALVALRREGVLRPNDRARLSAEYGAPKNVNMLIGKPNFAALDRATRRIGKAVDSAGSLIGAFKEGGAKILGSLFFFLLSSPSVDDTHEDYYADVEFEEDEAWSAGLSSGGSPEFWGVAGSPDKGSDLLNYYRHAAEQGDASAQLRLGIVRYAGSNGVAQDLKAAAKLFEASATKQQEDPAAVAGDASAAGWTGHMYSRGLGVQRDDLTALKWLRIGEAGGDAVAANALGLMQLQGVGGLKRDAEKAATLFRRASEAGLMESVYNLGMLHLGWDGHDETEASCIDNLRDKTHRVVTAETLAAKVAAAAKKAVGQNVVVEVSVVGDDATVLLPGTAAVEVGKAVQFLTVAAQNGHVKALHKVGRLYAHGIGVAKSCDVATSAYKSVAERGPWVSIFTEALAVLKKGDIVGARLAYARLAEAGYEVAISNAAWLLQAEASDARRDTTKRSCGGLGSEECEIRARRLYELAAKQGNAEAWVKLGDLDYYGRGINQQEEDASSEEKRLQRAVAHYQSAHELRHGQASFNLAWCYHRGLGVKRRDLHLAKRHYGLAAEHAVEALWPTRLALALVHAERAKDSLFLFFSSSQPGLTSLLSSLKKQAPPTSNTASHAPSSNTASHGALVLNAEDAALVTLLIALVALLVFKALQRRPPAAAAPHEHED